MLRLRRLGGGGSSYGLSACEHLFRLDYVFSGSLSSDSLQAQKLSIRPRLFEELNHNHGKLSWYNAAKKGSNQQILSEGHAHCFLLCQGVGQPRIFTFFTNSYSQIQNSNLVYASDHFS